MNKKDIKYLVEAEHIFYLDWVYAQLMDGEEESKIKLVRWLVVHDICIELGLREKLTLKLYEGETKQDYKERYKEYMK